MAEREECVNCDAFFGEPKRELIKSKTEGGIKVKFYRKICPNCKRFMGDTRPVYYK